VQSKPNLFSKHFLENSREHSVHEKLYSAAIRKRELSVQEQSPVVNRRISKDSPENHHIWTKLYEDALLRRKSSVSKAMQVLKSIKQSQFHSRSLTPNQEGQTQLILSQKVHRDLTWIFQFKKWSLQTPLTLKRFHQAMELLGFFKKDSLSNHIEL